MPQTNYWFNVPPLKKSFSTIPYQNKSSISVYNNSIHIFAANRKKSNFEPYSLHERGTIQEFSQKSRFRMLKLLSKIHIQSYDTIFFTSSTYHDNYPLDLINLKLHLKKYLTYLKRLYPDVAIIWRLELQKRGAPHFHFFFFFQNKYSDRYINNFKKNTSNVWLRCIEDSDQYLKLYSVKTDLIDNTEKVFSYISKYAGKTNSKTAINNLGRRWGYSKNLIFKEIDMIEISDDLLKIFTKNLLSWLDTKNVTDKDFQDYVLNSQQVDILIPVREFFIIFEKSFLEYKKTFSDSDNLHSYVNTKIGYNNLYKPVTFIT